MVQTVLGPVSPETLGPTTAHEHLLLDFSVVFQEPESASERGLAFQPVDLDNLAWVRYDPFRSRDNLTLIDEDTTVEEAMLFRAAGGRTIVDTTTRGIGRDPAAAARISRRTGLNVVIGSGYYVGASHPDGMDAMSEDEIAAEIVADLTTGQRGVRAGVIGELGCSWPLWENERKVLRAGARAQVETGASIIIHPRQERGRAVRDSGRAGRRGRGRGARGHRAPGAGPTSTPAGCWSWPGPAATWRTTSLGGRRRTSRWLRPTSPATPSASGS